MPQATRTQRMEARLRPDQKTRIERAAAIKGLSISDFIVQNADEAAIRTIEQHETWVLSERDREFFFNSILNPPEPSPALRESAEWFKERMRLK